MNITKNFSTTLLIEQSPQLVFDAINNVRGWWSQNIEGDTATLNSVFKYAYRDVHLCTIKVIELTSGHKVVWDVLDNQFNFTKDKSEWIGNKIVFELTEKHGRTHLHFTHQGLVPEYECYDICQNAWSDYIHSSLRNLITTGKGQPNEKEE